VGVGPKNRNEQWFVAIVYKIVDAEDIADIGQEKSERFRIT
jgi:hypothetical protein